MNKELTEQIICQILSGLGIWPSDSINIEINKSLLDKQYLLSDKLTFEIDNDLLNCNLHGCQITTSDNKQFKILAANCTQDSLLPEFCFLVHLQDSPTYCGYLIFNKSNYQYDSEAMIAVTTDNKNWMPCNIYLQATFLAGMERLKDLCFSWKSCNSYQDEYKLLLSFLKFHNSFYSN